MTALPPNEAARMARGVYLLREQTISAMHGGNTELGCEGLFKVDDSSRFVGASGGLFSKPLSGFGYIAEGDGTCQGEIVVVTRGTNMGADWASNLNVSVEFGSSGMIVHAGFNEIWKSFAGEIRSFMQGRNPSAPSTASATAWGGALQPERRLLLGSVKNRGVFRLPLVVDTPGIGSRARESLQPVALYTL